MLNFRLLYMVLSPRSVSIYLGILGFLGFSVLLDIALFFKLAFLLGPWIVMATFAVLTAVDVFIIYKLVEVRNSRLMESIRNGHFHETLFTDYVSALITGIFLVPPGLINTIIAITILLPPFSRKIGNKLAQSSGLDWTEAYEYLRLIQL